MTVKREQLAQIPRVVMIASVLMATTPIPMETVVSKYAQKVFGALVIPVLILMNVATPISMSVKMEPHVTIMMVDIAASVPAVLKRIQMEIVSAQVIKMNDLLYDNIKWSFNSPSIVLGRSPAL